jgi:hypothetical protein
MLNGHPQIRMSLDPFIPLFRFYRDSLLKSVNAEHLLAHASSSVLDDYYFSAEKLQIMKAIQGADPDIPFEMSRWDDLKRAISNRMKLASVNLIPHLDKLPAPTFRETFYNTTKVISAVSESDLAWVGFNDNWAVEFFPLIARLIPDAKFILHIRDPRAVVNSSEFAEPDPGKRPTVLSFARHLRKYVAFSVILPNDPNLCGRLMVTRYEPFIEDPGGEVRRMTDFLGVDFHSDMLDISRFRKADGGPWPSDWDIYRSSTDIWRQEMPREMVEIVEFVCDPDMRLHGYQPHIYDEASGLSHTAFAYAVRNSRECLGWRTDFQEIERTLGGEFYRKAMLVAKDAPSVDEIERCFLFQEVFRQTQALRLSANNYS